MTTEDELRVKLMIAETRIIQLERELLAERRRAPQPLSKTIPKQVRVQVRHCISALSRRTKGLLALTEGRCFYCDCELTPFTVTADHLVPVSKGGKSNMRNLVPSCSVCNGAKTNRLPTEDEMQRAIQLHDAREERLRVPPGKVVHVKHWTHWHERKAETGQLVSSGADSE